MNLQELSNQVIAQANIIDIIGEVVELKKQKGGHWGLCPFHNDNHASMSVIDRDNMKIFNCFSCGEKGNVISFYAKYYGISYGQATIKLALKLGIPVDNYLLSDNHQNEKLYKIMEETQNFYSFYLMNSTESKEALEYLENRGITKEIIEEFKIGLAPSSMDDLHQTLNGLNINELDQIELGLVNTNQAGKNYDVFRKRIIFPIINQYNKIVGFSGRTFLSDQKNESKYVNSKETKIFHKGNILYNFYNAQKVGRTENRIFVFEGFMDVIAGHKAGIYNAVAAMGTAFTDEHVKKLLNVTNNIILCFDGDEAGINALRKTVLAFSKYNMIPNAVILPDGMDPDEYLNKFGKDQLKAYLSLNHKNALDVLYEYELSKVLVNNTLINDIIKLEAFKQNVFSIVLGISQGTIIEHYLNRLANDLNLSYEIIKKDFEQFINSNNTNYVQTKQVVNAPVIEEIKVEDFNQPLSQIKLKGTVKRKHQLALRGIIAEMLKDHHRFHQAFERIGEDIYYICKELEEYTSIILDIHHYYNEKTDYVSKRYFINNPEILYNNKDSKQYLMCLDIMNSIEYKNPSNERAFHENIDCIKELIKYQMIDWYRNEVRTNKTDKNVANLISHIKDTTKIKRNIKKG